MSRDNLEIVRRVNHATNGIRFTQLERQRLRRMGYEGNEQTIPEEVTAA